MDTWEMNWQGGMGNAIGKNKKWEMQLGRIRNGKCICQQGKERWEGACMELQN